MRWEAEGSDWPNRQFSRFLGAAGIHWHVQVAGEGPVVLLVHGTGASTHSWRDILPSLARTHTVVAPDLPGHGFTESVPARLLSIDAIGRGLAGLLDALELAPAHAVGHSAGAAILCRMALDGRIAPHRLIGINGAFMPFGGAAHALFAPCARVLASNGLIAGLISRHAGDVAMVRRIVAGTGSTLDQQGLDWYARLVRTPTHVAAALGMMSRWDLQELARDLPRLRAPLTLVVGGADRAVPPCQAQWVRGRLPAAEIAMLPGLGHLAHEEAPQRVLAVLAPLLAR